MQHWFRSTETRWLSAGWLYYILGAIVLAHIRKNTSFHSRMQIYFTSPGITSHLTQSQLLCLCVCVHVKVFEHVRIFFPTSENGFIEALKQRRSHVRALVSFIDLWNWSSWQNNPIMWEERMERNGINGLPTDGATSCHADSSAPVVCRDRCWTSEHSSHPVYICTCY